MLVSVLFLNFCSQNPSLRTEPPQKSVADSETDKGEVSEDISLVEIKGVDVALPNVSRPVFENLDHSLSLLEQPIYQTGLASWYGRDFNGKRTANGEIYDMHKLTAAHPELPFHTLVEVENIDNQKKVIVRINDRGPHYKGRIIDLSKGAASRLGLMETGTAPVHLRIFVPGQNPNYNYSTGDFAAVAESQSVPSPEPNNPVIAAGRFYLQLGAFSVRENAEEMVDHLDDLVPDIPVSIQYQNKLYKVLSQAFETRDLAKRVLQRLKENGFEAFLVTR